MRSKRISKFRVKYKKLLTGIQILSLWGLLIIGATEINTYTNATFNDVVEVTGSLHVDWDDGIWDKSSLEFIEQGIESEKPNRIFAVIKNGNDSEAMEGTVDFEVYYINSGNPKSGEKIHTGTVPALASGESYKLYFEPEQDGNYMFKAYQREGHKGEGKLWSEAIKVKTIESNPEDSAEIKTEEDIEKNTISEEDTITEVKDGKEDTRNNSNENNEETIETSEATEKVNKTAEGSVEDETSSKKKTETKDDESQSDVEVSEEESTNPAQKDESTSNEADGSNIEKEKEDENEKDPEDNK